MRTTMPTEPDQILSEEAVREIEARYKDASPGPWTSDNEQDSEHRYQYYIVLDPESRSVMDTLNSSIGEIHEEADEDGVYRWDDVARRNIAFAAHAREDVPALCQTVRVLAQCLRDLSDDGCYEACWIRWGKERGDDQYHSDACKTAQRLIENLDHKRRVNYQWAT